MYCNKCGKYREPGDKFCEGCGNKFDDAQGATGAGLPPPVIVMPSNNNQQSNGGQSYGGQQYGQQQWGQQQTVNVQYDNRPYDRGGFWWFVLGLILGFIISLILFIVWNNMYPRRAKAILIGGIIGSVISFFLIMYA